MARLLLNDRTLIPAFHLPDGDGIVFDSSDLKRKKNLILFLLSDLRPGFLLKIEEARVSFLARNAETCVISSAPLSQVREACKKHRLTFPVLCDEDRKVSEKFIAAAANESFAGLFITDKFGEVFFQYLTTNAAELPAMDEIVKSLDFIESQCPECGGGL